jgi:hypothetical protein
MMRFEREIGDMIVLASHFQFAAPVWDGNSDSLKNIPRDTLNGTAQAIPLVPIPNRFLIPSLKVLADYVPFQLKTMRC